MKKKIIITLSRVFPVTHSRRGEPTGFASKLASGEKKHTIRRNYDLWKVNAEKMERGKFYLSIRQWSGKPYNSPQVEIAQRHNPIGVQPVELYYHADNDTITAKIDGREWLDADCYTLAKNDGLSVQDFKEWFFGKTANKQEQTSSLDLPSESSLGIATDPKEDKVFKGCIIHFTDFRY